MKQAKKFFKSVFKSPVLLIFAIICFTLLPSAINRNSISFRSAIVTAVGIDMNENSDIVIYSEISISSVSESLAENSKILSASGKTVGDAFANLNLIFGRKLKLGHTRFVLIGSTISQQNVTSLLDRLIRTNKIRNIVQLIYCSSSVEEMLNTGVELKKETGLRLSDILCHQQETSTTSLNSNIDSFYKGYFSQGGISKINAVNLTSEQMQGVSSTAIVQKEQSGNAQSQTNESNMGGSSENKASSNDGSKFISNRGEVAIFKDGKLEVVLDEFVSQGLDWLSGDYSPKEILVPVSSDKRLKGASINFDILNKKVFTETFFYKKMPFMSVKILISLDIDEIVDIDEKNIEINYDLVGEEIKRDIGKVIRQQISLATKESKRLKLDILKLNDIFYANNYNDYMEYIRMGNTLEDIIENTQISVDVEIKII